MRLTKVATAMVRVAAASELFPFLCPFLSPFLGRSVGRPSADSCVRFAVSNVTRLPVFGVLGARACG
jgi:hypothetical protein